MIRTRIVPGAAVAAAVLALAACGSSGGSKSSGTTSTTAGSSATSQTSAASGTPALKTASNAKFGTIVVDADGRTVYTLTKNGQAVACTGQCVSVWPPVILPTGQTTATGTGVSDVGTAPAAGGGTQVTQGGLPLYRFAGDSGPADAKGDGISSFGGVWHVVKVGGGASGAGGASSSSTGSGLGY